MQNVSVTIISLVSAKASFFEGAGFFNFHYYLVGGGFLCLPFTYGRDPAPVVRLLVIGDEPRDRDLRDVGQDLANVG